MRTSKMRKSSARCWTKSYSKCHKEGSGGSVWICATARASEAKFRSKTLSRRSWRFVVESQRQMSQDDGELSAFCRVISRKKTPMRYLSLTAGKMFFIITKKQIEPAFWVL